VLRFEHPFQGKQAQEFYYPGKVPYRRQERNHTREEGMDGRRRISDGKFLMVIFHEESGRHKNSASTQILADLLIKRQRLKS
jgi:hypothetical protein